MQHSITAAAPAQAYPKVSHRLLLRINAARDASRRHANPAIAIAAVDAAWRRTCGDRFAARRAGWAAVDASRAGEG